MNGKCRYVQYHWLKMAVILGKRIKLLMCLVSRISETPQIHGQDFPRVECQYFIVQLFFLKSSIKYEKLAYSVHLPPFLFTAFPIEKKKVQFQNGLPFSCKASAPLRRYLNQSKATSFIRWPTSQHLQAMSDFRVQIKKTRQLENRTKHPITAFVSLPLWPPDNYYNCPNNQKRRCILFFLLRTAFKVPAWWW